MTYDVGAQDICNSKLPTDQERELEQQAREECERLAQEAGDEEEGSSSSSSDADDDSEEEAPPKKRKRPSEACSTAKAKRGGKKRKEGGSSAESLPTRTTRSVSRKSDTTQQDSVRTATKTTSDPNPITSASSNVTNPVPAAAVSSFDRFPSSTAPAALTSSAPPPELMDVDVAAVTQTNDQKSSDTVGNGMDVVDSCDVTDQSGSSVPMVVEGVIDADTDEHDTSTVYTQTCPNDAGEWFKNLYPLISDVSLGVKFVELTEALTQLERAYGWEVGKKSLAARKRPHETTAWINAGRNKRSLKQEEIETFAGEWWAWWVSMLPDWRGVDAKKPDRPLAPRETVEETTWGKLEVPGKNSMLTVVASLAMWGSGVSKSGNRQGYEQRKKDWLEAVADTRFMVERLRAYVDNR